MRLARAVLTLGVAWTLALAQEAGPQVAYASDRPTLLVGVLKYLAQQAGYELEVPLAPAFLKRVSARASGDFAAAVGALLAEHAPGYRLEGAPPKFRVVKAGDAGPAGGGSSPTGSVEKAKLPETPRTAEDAGKGGDRYLVIGADGSVLEGEMPSLAVAMVVDAVVTVKDGAVDLVLTPLGPACLYRGGEKVCLRALTPGLEGEIPVRLGGETYVVRYRVVADAVVLYRYSLGGGLPAKDPDIVPKPLAPTPPQSPEAKRASPPSPSKEEDKPTPAAPAPKPVDKLPPGSWWREGREVLWAGLSLAKAPPGGAWLSVGAFRNPGNAAALFSRIKGMGLAPALAVTSQGTYVVLAPDREEARALLRKAGLPFVPFR